MSTLNVRLPDDLEALLEREARRSHKPRSELAREAIRAHLAQLERARFMSEMGRAAHAIGADPALRRDAETIAGEFQALEDEAGEYVTDADAGEAWWR